MCFYFVFKTSRSVCVIEKEKQRKTMLKLNHLRKIITVSLIYDLKNKYNNIQNIHNKINISYQ